MARPSATGGARPDNHTGIPELEYILAAGFFTPSAVLRSVGINKIAMSIIRIAICIS